MSPWFESPQRLARLALSCRARWSFPIQSLMTPFHQNFTLRPRKGPATIGKHSSCIVRSAAARPGMVQIRPDPPRISSENSLESLTRQIPPPPLIAEANATLFGDRNRILELDEAALRMRHCGLDGEDHVGLQRSGRVIALISPRLVAGQARRFMTDEAHAMRHKIQIYPVGRGVHKLMGRSENLSPCSAAADRAACPLLDFLDHTEKVHKLGIWLT